MSEQVIILREAKRGCGYRRPGKDGTGLYLMGEITWSVCERLPFPLTVCPCCGAGVKHTRAFRWIEPTKLFAPEFEPRCAVFKTPIGSVLAPDIVARHPHERCMMCTPPPSKHGLMWVGHQHYTARSFGLEALEVGVSKKIGAIPRDLEIGEQFVYLAHIKAVGDFKEGPDAMTPGVFMVFKPSHVDVVIDDENDIPKKALNLKKRHGDNVRLVKVIPE